MLPFLVAKGAKGVPWPGKEPSKVSDNSANAPQQLTAPHRRAILVWMTFTIGTYVLTVTVANVALPQLQGAFTATREEITWIITSNFLATVIATPMSGWLNSRFGRRRVMLWAATIFAIATTLCGLANSLGEMVVYRAVQGFAGAPLLPLGQAIILEIYPNPATAASSCYGASVLPSVPSWRPSSAAMRRRVTAGDGSFSWWYRSP